MRVKTDTLLCLLDRNYKDIWRYYVIPAPGDSIGDQKQLSPGSDWLSKATRLDNLGDLCRVAKRLITSTSRQPYSRSHNSGSFTLRGRDDE